RRSSDLRKGHIALLHQMGQDGGGGGLPMGSGHRQAIGIPGDDPQDLRTFHYGEAPFPEMVELGMGSRYRRGIYHKGPGVSEGFRQQLHPILEMDLDPQFPQTLGNRAWGLVITGHSFAHIMEIPGQGRHADPSDPNKINAMYIL